MHNTQLIKGTLKTIILKLLAENGPMYGYEITRTVEQLTQGELLLTEGALYPTLHKLEAEGLLVTEKKKANGRTRKYYALTPTGSVATKTKVQEFEAFVHLMQRLLRPKTT